MRLRPERSCMTPMSSSPPKRASGIDYSFVLSSELKLKLLVPDVIQIERGAFRVHVQIGRPAESAADRSKVLSFQVNRELLRFRGQDHRTDSGYVRIRVFSGNAADFEFFDAFAAFFAANPK